jgi:general L-amino acid transport system substrate-binding protein
MMPRRSLFFACLFCLVVTLIACSQVASSSTLTTVMSRGRLVCGVNGQRPGFSFQAPGGNYSGLDADYCRAIASALFDDPTKVEFRRVTRQDASAALANQTVDIVLGDTPWSIEQERDPAIDFAPPLFYDGQGMMAIANLDLEAVEQFRGKTICVLDNSPDFAALKTFFQKVAIPISPVLLNGESDLFISFANGNCEVVTAQRSELAIHRQSLTHPDRYQLLDLTISQEPLAPIVRSNDSQWLDVVRWIIYGTFRAEELGISQKNVMGLSPSSDAEIRRFLGEEGDYGSGLNLPNDFIKRVIRHVGNYAEIYQRNIAEPFNLPRGINQLWVNGGLISPMPFR